MDTKIFIINGYGGVGKDTFVELLIEKSNNDNNLRKYNIFNVSSIDPIKELAKSEYNWDGVKTEESRLMLSNLKKEKGKGFCNNIIIESIKEKKGRNCYFVHIREIYEIEDFIEKSVKELGIKPETILISNNRIKPITSNESDKNVENYTYNNYISNNSDLTTLKRRVENFYYNKIVL